MPDTNPSIGSMKSMGSIRSKPTPRLLHLVSAPCLPHFVSLRFVPTLRPLTLSLRFDEPSIQGSGVWIHIQEREDERTPFPSEGHVGHNYYNKKFSNETREQTYVLSNLLPAKTREASPAVTEDQLLTVIKDHLSKLNSGLLALHQRVEERLQRMDALEEKSNG